MIGIALTITPDGSTVAKTYREEIPVEDIQAAVGGFVELVPGFGSVGEYKCAVFCNEDGKAAELPRNVFADHLWDQALATTGESRIDAHGRERDFLAGPIVIVMGDHEFLASL